MLLDRPVYITSNGITELEEELAFLRTVKRLEIIDRQDATIINVGDTVIIQDSEGKIEEYTIVGIAEANPSVGLISNESPLGSTLLGYTINDEVLVKAPAGEIRYRVVAHT
jgi:transcription elongation factor GreA